MMAGCPVEIEPLNAKTFAPFGTVFGLPFAQTPDARAFTTAASDFWHVHDFEPGDDGQTEVLWVNYRNTSLRVPSLEVHWLTEQAIVPLGGGVIIHIVCLSRDDGSRLPDLSALRAFKLGDGMGLCMRPGVWHSTRVLSGQTACLMLTRRSTTRELVAHLNGQAAAVESKIVELDEAAVTLQL